MNMQDNIWMCVCSFFFLGQFSLDKHGLLISGQEGQLDRWVEHFEEVLNRPASAVRLDIPKAATPLEIKCSRPSETEIKAAINQQKSGKAADPNNIPPEALEIHPNLRTEMPYAFLGEFRMRKGWRQIGQRVIL